MRKAVAPVVYLACPIDRVQGSAKRELTELRDECRVALDNHQFIFFDPTAGWHVPTILRLASGLLPPSIGTVDFAAVDSADALLALLPDGYATLGVPMEIERAIGRGIPIVVVGQNVVARSPLLSGRVPVYNLNQIDLAVRHLRELCNRMPELLTIKMIGDGQTPTRSYPDDCGFDLYTYIDPEVGKTQESINSFTSLSDHHLAFRNPDGLCTPANFDYAAYEVGPGKFFDVDCGTSVELPPGVWGLITGRSSAIRKRSLLVVNGIIDTGYRGRLFMPVLNVGRERQVLRAGERIGQLILMQNVTFGYEVARVDFLSPSERGEKGRGSTGA